jgi:hypothetical protein
LDVICVVLGCGIDELLRPEPGTVAAPAGLGLDLPTSGTVTVSGRRYLDRLRPMLRPA